MSLVMWIGFGLLSIAVGILLLTAYEGLKVDVKTRKYKLYISLLGYKAGSYIKFKSIEKVYINRVIEVQKSHSRSGMISNAEKYVFKAFIKLDNGDKVHLDTDESQETLENRVDLYIAELKAVCNPDL